MRKEPVLPTFKILLDIQLESYDSIEYCKCHLLLEIKSGFFENRASLDRISDFFLFHPNNPYSELFSKIVLKGSIPLWFLRKREKLNYAILLSRH